MSMEYWSAISPVVQHQYHWAHSMSKSEIEIRLQDAGSQAYLSAEFQLAGLSGGDIGESQLVCINQAPSLLVSNTDAFGGAAPASITYQSAGFSCEWQLEEHCKMLPIKHISQEHCLLPPGSGGGLLIIQGPLRSAMNCGSQWAVSREIQPCMAIKAGLCMHSMVMI